MSIQTPPAINLAAAFAFRGVSLRAARDADTPFQRALFETARPDAAFLAAWPEDAHKTFLDQQFQFQGIHYARTYPYADWLVVMANGAPIGRLILDRAADEWCIVDIALMPPWRGQGIGTHLLRALQAAAAAAGTKTMRLTVDAANAAQHLYERLGFVRTEDAPPNIAMAWRPSRDQLKTA